MLNRRHLLAATAGAASLGALPARARTAEAPAQALALYDQIFEGMLAADPLCPYHPHAGASDPLATPKSAVHQ